MKRLGFIVFCMMSMLSSYGQNPNAVLGNGWVQPMDYKVNNADQLEWVKQINITKREDYFIECKIQIKDGGSTDYFNFKLKNIRKKGDIITADLSHVSIDSPDGMLIIPEKAHGTFTSNCATQLETLDLYFDYTRKSEVHYVISWKVFDYNPTGKIYKALVSQSCKRTTQGAFMIYTYCELEFEKDSVITLRYWTSTNFPSEGTHSQTGKKYAWEKSHENAITIYGFELCDIFIMQGTQLIGRKELGNNKYHETIFDEIRK